MKLTLPLGLIIAAATSLACSSDEGNDPRPTGGTGGTGTGSAGTSAGGTGGGAGGTGGTSGGAGGAGGAPAQNFTRGTPFTITADGNVLDGSGDTGVNGGTFLAQSSVMRVEATTAHRDGALCFSGTTEVVPDGDSYGTHWGAELGLNLKLIPDPAAPAPAADAGADAGAEVPLIPDPAGWPYGNVIGFSYRIVGNDPAAADQGVPVTRVRFKALPVGSVGANDNYCSNRNDLVDQKVEDVLFNDITFECYNGDGNPSIGPDQATINRVNPGPPRVVETPANPRALQNIAWQVSSDVVATTPLPIPFNFCITELTPLLAP